MSLQPSLEGFLGSMRACLGHLQTPHVVELLHCLPIKFLAENFIDFFVQSVIAHGHVFLPAASFSTTGVAPSWHVRQLSSESQVLPTNQISQNIIKKETPNVLALKLWHSTAECSKT